VPGSLLNRSGIMLESLTSNADANSVAVGFSVPYAIFHITGTRRMPRRDSLFAAIAANGSTGTLGAQDEADIIEIVEDHLRQALGGAA
jgi:phage gpG-like protein